LAILVLLLLVFKPVLSYSHEVLRRAGLCLLVDTSRSMSVRDYPNSPSRLERVRTELEPRLAALRETFDAYLYTFDTTASRVTGKLPAEATGEATDLGRAVTTALQEIPRDNLAGLVLVSDGIHNGPGDAAETVARSAAPPVYTVGVGSDLTAESGFQDIGFVGLEAPEEATVNTRTDIIARLDATGFADRTVEVQLREIPPGGGQAAPLASARLVLDGRPGPQEVHLQVTPETKGAQRYELFVPPDAKERLLENNRHEFYLLAVEPRIKVLYIETLRPEYGPLKQVLETDPNVDVLSLVQIRQGTFLKSGNLRGPAVSAFPRTREELKQFDVFIIGSLDAALLAREQMEALRDLVRDEGRGLLLIGGSAALGAGGYGGSPLEEALPALLGPRTVGQITEPFTMELTAEGRAHAIFAGTGDFFRYLGQAAQKNLPVLLGCNRLAGLKPGAALLAVHPGPQPDGRPAPVLAVQQFGKGRSAVFTGDTTYQWDLYFKVIGRESPYVKFWGQMVRYLAGQEAVERPTQPGLALALRKPLYRPGEPVVLEATVVEEEGRATNLAAVRAEILQPDGQTRAESLPNVPGSSGLYRTTLQPDAAGKYTVRLRAEKDGRTLGAAEAEFTVVQPNHEFERLAIDEGLLRALAERTRGKYYRLTSLNELFDGLRRRQTAESEHREWPLLDQQVLRLPGTVLTVTMTHLMFALFLALLTVEWLIRRRYLLQ